VFDSVLAADAALRAWFTTHHTPWLDAVMLTLSSLGQAGTLWIILAAVARLENPRRAGRLWQMLLAIGLAYLLVDYVLKPGFARTRPFDAMLDVRIVGFRPVTYSFPSGHACSAFAGAWVLTLMWHRIAWLFWILAALIAFSRIYIGVHYPIDVLAGALLGLVVGALVTGGRACYIERPSPRAAASHGP
jgi:undecaprenyl-diphosphatase